MSYFPQNIQQKTGSYTGDGTTSMAITGVGFTPIYVRIWESETFDGANLDIYETIDIIMALNVSGGAIDLLSDEFVTNRIISLDADGFTVDDNSSNSHPNQNGQNYDYICLG